MFVIVHGGSGMFIPAQLNGYANVRAHLDRWKPVVQYGNPRVSLTPLLKCGALPLLIALLLVTEPVWFLATGVLYSVCVWQVLANLWSVIRGATWRQLAAEARVPPSADERRGVLMPRPALQAMMSFAALSVPPLARALILLLNL